MPERNAAVGYAAIKKESTAGTPVTPDVYTPYYKQNISTDFHLMADTPVYGNRFKNFQHLRGSRSHGGGITVMAEPDTAARWLDMLLSKSSTSGSDPYTHVFGVSNNTPPNSYTVDVSLGSQVIRYWGVQASNLNIAWEDEKMQFELDVAALGSFHGREISEVDTTDVTLKTDYDDNPTKGLVDGDLVSIVDPTGAVATLNTTVSSVDDETGVTLGASAAAFSAGAMIVLRPATPSLSVKRPFLWGLTRYFFDDTVADALTASSDADNQTRLDPGTELSIMNEFEENEGSKRSGGFDPASLIRTVVDYSFKIKKFFDGPEDIKNWNALTKRALVMKSFSGASNEYELRIALHNMTQKNQTPETESASTIYTEPDFGANYDQSDGKGVEVTVIDAVSTI